MGYIVINENYCKGCELCIMACPKSLIESGEQINQIGYHEDRDGQCNGCTLCAVACPDVAIEVYR